MTPITEKSGFKPKDVEEPIDYYWHRPLAALLVRGIAEWPVTPNQVTLASGAAGLLAGVTILLGVWFGRGPVVAGGFLLLLSIMLDCADGQLARLRGVSSPVGRALDGLVDGVAPLAVLHGLAFYVVSRGFSWVSVWTIGWAAGASMLWHAQVYDAQKNIYLHCSRPDFSLGGATLLTPEAMEALAREFDRTGERAYAWLMRVFVRWTRTQLRALSPWLDPARTPHNAAEHELFVAMFKRPMTVLSWLGFGTHLFLVTLTCWLVPLDPRVIWLLFLAMLVPMNAACLWVVGTKGAREAAFAARLAEMRAAADAA